MELDVWVTRYALTSGVERVRVRSTANPQVVEKMAGGVVIGRFGAGDWFTSYAAAAENALDRIQSQLLRIANQRRHLETIERELRGTD